MSRRRISRATGGRRLAFLLGVAIVACAACRGSGPDPVDASPSPQAKAEPTPLANPPTPASTASAAPQGPDGATAPEPIPTDRALAADAPRDPAREPGARETVRDLTGYVLQAVVRTGEGPGPPKAPEVNVPAIDVARRQTEARIALTLAARRARFLPAGRVVP